MRTYVLILFAAVIIQSCTSPQKRIETSDSTTVTDSIIAVDSTIAVIEKTPVLFKGLYTFGNEVRVFRDCSGSQSVYWVIDSIGGLRDKYEKTNRFPIPMKVYMRKSRATYLANRIWVMHQNTKTFLW